MKKIVFYEYPNCGTCKKALKFLATRRYAVDKRDIFAQPPSREELKTMLGYYGGDFRKLFNTAGHVYQEMQLAKKLATFSEDQALDLLASNGRLIKRPFLLMDSRGIVGFNEKEWKELFAP
jgi:arsenate reductase (glutaredoxin)